MLDTNSGDRTGRPPSCHDEVMDPQRFRAVIATGLGGRAVITVPFDPDETWGTKADHPVGGAIDGRQVRGRLSPSGSGWVFDRRRTGIFTRSGDHDQASRQVAVLAGQLGEPGAPTH